MKNILSIAFLLMYCISNAQEFRTEKNAIIGNFEFENKNKSELFTSLNNWISLNYDMSKDVQMNDLESGKIIISGMNEISYRSLAKALYPNKKGIRAFDPLKFNHIIEIDVKDNSYEIIYKIIDLATENVGKDNLFFKCIDLNRTNEIAIRKYNEQNTLFLTEALVKKKKIAEYSALARPMFEEINSTLLINLKQTMLQIGQAVLDPENVVL